MDDWYLSTQQHMSNGMIFVAALLGLAVILPICLVLERRERKAKQESAAVKVDNPEPRR